MFLLKFLLALILQRKSLKMRDCGGEGNSTPVLVAIRANVYMFIRR